MNHGSTFLQHIDKYYVIITKCFVCSKILCRSCFNEDYDNIIEYKDVKFLTVLSRGVSQLGGLIPSGFGSSVRVFEGSVRVSGCRWAPKKTNVSFKNLVKPTIDEPTRINLQVSV